MKKLFKLLPFVLALCLVFSSVPAYASNTDNVYTLPDGEIELNLSENSDGATVTFAKQSDGTFKCITDDQLNTLTATTEVVKFHVGFSDWTGGKIIDGDLHWEATSNLPSLVSVYCTAYIESTSWIFPEEYGKWDVSETGLGGVTHATNSKEIIHFADNEVRSIRVGYRNMRLVTITQTYTGSDSEVIQAP